MATPPKTTKRHRGTEAPKCELCGARHWLRDGHATGKVILAQEAGGFRSPAIIVPSEITIPATIQDAVFVLEGVGSLLSATKWGTAAIVYAFTREGSRGPGANPETLKSESLSLPDFAALGIRGLKSDNSVRKYRGAWQWAIDKGWARFAKPSQTVELPTEPFPDENGPHVSQNSGENEWYTPVEYIEAARAALGSIDLDPASCETANEVVKASAFYSLEDDGLAHDWHGRVWMNPPYAAALVGQFTAKLARHFTQGDVEAAIVLVNNATETDWFYGVAVHASSICFPRQRVKFWGPDQTVGAPLQGQAVLYLGAKAADFIVAYRDFGLIVVPA